MIVYFYLWIILQNLTNFSQTDFKKTSQDFTTSSTCAPWHSPCAQLNTVFPFSRYSTKGLYIFSLAEPDHFMSLLNGERWYIAISRLIPTLFAGKLWPAKLSDEARGHSGRSNLSGPRFGLLLSALYIPWWSALRTSTSWSLEELYVCFCEQHDNEDLDSDSAQFCQTQFLIHTIYMLFAIAYKSQWNTPMISHVGKNLCNHYTPPAWVVAFASTYSYPILLNLTASHSTESI